MRGLNALDFVVIVAYLVGITLLGMWVGRRQRDAKDYFVADREIPWWAVMFSIVASETSALTFISIPGLAYIGNLGFLEIAAGYLVGRIVLAYTLLPRYYEGNLVTAYALLEKRFGLGARRFTSIVFMVTRGMADSVRVFATAVPIALIIGPLLPAAAVMPVAVLVLGTLTVIYTIRGGMRAVVWTEIVQASVYIFGGAAAVVLVGHLVAGGWSSILSAASAAGKLQVISWYTGFDQPNTMFAGLIGGAFLSMASHGADQLIVQRLLSARSLKSAQAAVIGSGVAVIIQFALFLFLGVGLWALFGGRHFATPDSIFPTFIVDSMPHGLVGLLLAAILAATMSTHSGAINSLAAASTHDIYLPHNRPRARRSAHPPRRPRLRAPLGRRAHRRRAALSGEHHDARRRRGAVDRVVHLRRTARRILPRYLLAARATVRRDPRHVGRHLRDEHHRLREAAHRRVSVARRARSEQFPRSRILGTSSSGPRSHCSSAWPASLTHARPVVTPAAST